jgi:hypothetical protein
LYVPPPNYVSLRISNGRYSNPRQAKNVSMHHRVDPKADENAFLKNKEKVVEKTKNKVEGIDEVNKIM